LPNTVSAKLETTEETQSATTKERKEFIDHLTVPPARKEVPLLDLLQASRRKPGRSQRVCAGECLSRTLVSAATGDFEVVPRMKGVLVLEEGSENVTGDDEIEDWQHLACECSSDGKASYAQVAKASAGSLPLS